LEAACDAEALNAAIETLELGDAFPQVDTSIDISIFEAEAAEYVSSRTEKLDFIIDAVYNT